MINKNSKIYLKDYKPSDYLIDEVFFEFDIDDEVTIVKSELKINRNTVSANTTSNLVLNGEKLLLRSLALNNKKLQNNDFAITAETLTIYNCPSRFTLNIEVAIEPQNNTALYGLYKSNANYCTQCEPDGFRHITYFLDRPDVLTKVTTKIIADKTRFPTLLSNGNLIDKGELANNKHWVLWQDPSLKSIYLFALIAGDFACVEDVFITASGRRISLKIYAEKNYINQCDHAMRSLKQAMKWDEEFYGREYDLDVYMIVAISDFNMGAMENKGLNIFNAKYVLATKETATDFDFIHIASVIAHEYFHNWRGNRVTVRDWFQLSLKEGFTVFCDQEFTADLFTKSLKRIEDVTLMKTAQFAEDRSPLSHPVRPCFYVEVNNFYTLTVYDKGAEIVKMIKTMIGKEAFKKGAALFFQDFDGKAATIENFLYCMSSVSGRDFSQFENWYDYAGTPVVDVISEYKKNEKIFTLTVNQKLSKYPDVYFNFPFSLGLLDKDGRDLLSGSKDKILNITKQSETFVFNNIEEQPIPSLLCNFSAPVKLNYQYTNDELLFLLQNDHDDYNRWNAGQEFMVKALLETLEKYSINSKFLANAALINVFDDILLDSDLDFGLKAELLSLPSEEYLFEFLPVIDVDGIHSVTEFCKNEIALKLRNRLLDTYIKCKEEEYRIEAKSIGKRKLKNLALHYLMYLDDQEIFELCEDQYYNSNNMTDTLSSLTALINSEYKEKPKILNDFYDKWRAYPLVVDKWFAVHAMIKQDGALEKVKNLTLHKDFTLNNPNRVRALLGTFIKFNHVNFHNINGEGYKFLKDMLMKIDPLNPQLAVFLIKPLINWQRFDVVRGDLMKEQLVSIAKNNAISKNLREIVMEANI